MSKTKTYIKSIAIPVIIGGIVGFLISNAIDYTTLEKPFLSPPAVVFPIVWTILYITMGISYAILKTHQNVDSTVNVVYGLQLFLNALWPIFFFLLKWRLFAFLWILLLLFAIIAMITVFYKRNKLAALLQIPYLIWTAFASYLNLFVDILNG